MDSEVRPWGKFEVLAEGPGFKVKRIEVNPKSRTSLQSHEHRNECWTVVEGHAWVTVADEEAVLEPGDSVQFFSGTIHRLTNNDIVPLVLIEVQTGSYLGEDDIKRYEDDYDR